MRRVVFPGSRTFFIGFSLYRQQVTFETGNTSVFPLFRDLFLFFTSPTSSSFGRRLSACYLWIRCFRRRHSETYKHIVACVYANRPRPKGKPFLWTYPCARFNFSRRLFYRRCRCFPLPPSRTLWNFIHSNYRTWHVFIFNWNNKRINLRNKIMKITIFEHNKNNTRNFVFDHNKWNHDEPRCLLRS